MGIFSSIGKALGSVGKAVTGGLSGLWDFAKPVVGGALGLASDVAPAAASAYGTYLSKEGQEATNKANKEIAENQMAFQREMSNTAWERGMEDMRKAGLNPILAYQRGAATAPYGASIPMGNPYAGAGQSLGMGANTAVQAMQMKANVKKIDTEIQNIAEQTRTQRTVQDLNKVSAVLKSANIDVANASYSQIRAVTEKLKIDINKIIAETKRLRQQLKIAGFDEMNAQLKMEILRKFPWIATVDAFAPVTKAGSQAIELIGKFKPR